MKPTTIAAVYFLIWFICLFTVLPFEARASQHLDGPKVRGQADSAPHVFRAWTVVLRTSLVAAVVFGLFYLNYRFGWITLQTFDPIFRPPPEALRPN